MFVPEQQHWVTCFLNGKVILYNTCFPGYLSRSLEQVYGKASTNNTLGVSIQPVQSQTGSNDCGLFAVVFAYHAILGDDLATSQFVQGEIREHLLHCFIRTYDL